MHLGSIKGAPQRFVYGTNKAAAIDLTKAVAVYLASDESSFTTGTAQIIDGGWSN